MKVPQILKEKFVINSCFLLLVIILSCKPTSRLIQINETYNVAKAALKYVWSDSYMQSMAKSNYDTIVLFKKTSNYNKNKFEEIINKFQNINSQSKYRNPCADTIFKQFDFKDVVLDNELFNLWNIKRFNLPKVINKPINELSIEDVRIQFSIPIFNRFYNKSLIFVDYHNRGKIVYYLIKKKQWEVECELYTGYY